MVYGKRSGIAATTTGAAVAAVLRLTQPVVDLLADRSHRELLWVTAGHPDLAAQRHDRVSGQRALEDLLLAHVVREAFAFLILQ